MTPPTRPTRRVLLAGAVAATLSVGLIAAPALADTPIKDVSVIIEGKPVVVMDERTSATPSAWIVPDSGPKFEIDPQILADAGNPGRVRVTVAVPQEAVDTLSDSAESRLRKLGGVVVYPDKLGVSLVKAAQTVDALPTVLDVEGLPTAAATFDPALDTTITYDIAVINDLGGNPQWFDPADVSDLMTGLQTYLTEETDYPFTVDYTAGDVEYYTTALACDPGDGGFLYVWDEAAVKFGKPDVDWYYQPGHDRRHLLVIRPTCGIPDGPFEGAIGLAGVPSTQDIKQSGSLWVIDLNDGAGVDITTITTLAHETAHNWGLEHSDLRYCTGTTPSWDESDQGTCKMDEYGDYWELMGPATGVKTYLGATRKYQLDLLEPAQVKEYSSYATCPTETITANPTASPDHTSLQLVRALSPTPVDNLDGNVDLWYAIEAREHGSDVGVSVKWANGPWTALLQKPGKVLGTPEHYLTVGDRFATADDTLTVEVLSTDTTAKTATIRLGDALAPAPVDDSKTLEENATTTVDVLANDKMSNGVAMTADQKAGATLTVATAAAHGTCAVKDGKIEYTPDTGFAGSDSCVYKVAQCDGDSQTAKVDFKITPAPPVAEDDTVSTPKGVSLTGVDVVAGVPSTGQDTIPAGETYTLTLGTPTCTPAGNCGTFTVANGKIDYTVPDAAYIGTVQVEYTVTLANGESDKAKLTVYVGGPEANDDTLTVNAGSSNNTVDVSVNDTYPTGTGTPSYEIVAPPAHGTASVDSATGVVTYAPNPGYLGADSLEYKLTVGVPSDTAKVAITVKGTPPVAVADTATTPQSTAVTIDVLANDTATDAPTLTGPDGSATSWATAQGGTCQVVAGKLVYTPKAGFFSGPADTCDYRVTNADTLFDRGAVTVTVTKGAVVANDDTATTNEETAVAVAVLANDTWPAGETVTGLTVTGGANGTCAVDQVAPSVARSAALSSAIAEAVVGSSSTVVYTPNPGFMGVDTCEYTVTLANGNTDKATVTITVNQVVLAAADDAVTTKASTAVTIDILANDTLRPAAYGPVTIEVAPTANGTIIVVNDKLVYTPNPGFHGTDTIKYTLTQGSATATATITVTVEKPLAATGASTPVMIAFLAALMLIFGGILLVSRDRMGFVTTA